MTIRKVQSQISHALRNRNIDAKEADKILDATGKSLSNTEARLIGDMFEKSAVLGPGTDVRNLPLGAATISEGAAQKLNTFFIEQKLPYGENAGNIKGQIEAAIGTMDFSKKLDRAPRVDKLHQIHLPNPPGSADMPVQNAYYDSVKDHFYLHRTGGFSGMMNDWFGPVSLKDVQAPTPGPTDQNELRPETLDKATTAVAQAMGDPSIDWDNAPAYPPAGGAFKEALVLSERRINGNKFYALFPTGALSPTAPQDDPNDATMIFIKRVGPAGTAVVGPVPLDGTGPTQGPTTPQPPAISPDTADKAMRAWMHLSSVALIDWDSAADSPPLGTRFVEETLMAERRPDGFKFVGMFPAGPLSPSADPTDPNEAANFFMKRVAPDGSFKVMGPIPLDRPGQTNSDIRPETVERAMAAWTDFQTRARIAWDQAPQSPPMGSRFEEAELYAERRPGGHRFTALFPAGALSPTAPALDPNDATQFFVRRDGPGGPRVIGPVALPPQSAVSPQTLDRVRGTFQAALQNGNVNWTDVLNLPAGMGVTEAVFREDPGINPHTYTALIPSGGFPGTPPVDPNQASMFWVEVKSLYGGKQYAGPFTFN
jgi:hypothetical protein